MRPATVFAGDSEDGHLFIQCEFREGAMPVVSQKIGDDIFLRESGFLREPIVSLGTKMSSVHTR